MKNEGTFKSLHLERENPRDRVSRHLGHRLRSLSVRGPEKHTIADL